MSNHSPISDVRLLRAVELACERLGCTPADLAERTMRPTRRGGLRRTGAVVELREKVAYVVRCVTGESFPRVAWAMGMPSHSTLVEAHQRFVGRMEQDAGLAVEMIRAVVAVENALNTENVGGRRRLDDERQGEEGEEEGGERCGEAGGRRDEHCAAACER